MPSNPINLIFKIFLMLISSFVFINFKVILYIFDFF